MRGRKTRPKGVHVTMFGIVNLNTLHRWRERNVELVKTQLKLPNGATYTVCKPAAAFALSVSEETQQ